ncbi:MAG: tRNA (adenosine(37)-N6)-threonylcarbamoyltransferase complex dimerization subunit type 1 TsaB [Pirellulaceae bacterium]
MRILALETSTSGGTLALLEDSFVAAETTLAGDRRTAQTFAVAIDDALRQVAWEPLSIDLVAVTNGPGSFTGLRISVTAAKFFAYAARADLIAFNTLDVLVEQLPPDVPAACAVVDAQRQQMFAGVYQRKTDGSWHMSEPCRIVSRDELATLLQPHTLLTGPALAKLPSSVLADQPRAPATCWPPRAATLGTLAWHAHRAGIRTDLWQLQPNYYRPSYAEERRR